jgi:ubiquinone/menaquinone biosynthesis C-methylase UbiE
MDDRLGGQVSRSAAEIYEDFFVPALFREWTPRVAEAVKISAGQCVLDVACGTGVLAREAALRVGPSGTVVGLDRNGGMLAVAVRVAPAITWREGMADPFPFRMRPSTLLSANSG